MTSALTLLRRLPAPAAIAAVAGLAGLALRFGPAWVAETRAAPAHDALQVMADIVLIESRCGGLNVDYGKAFAFLQRNGIDPVDIMPTGTRRAAFDADIRRRAAPTDDGALCADLAAQRQADVPGVFTQRQ